MPFYDLKCPECGNEFNIMAKMSERESNLINCPQCGNNRLETVFKNINVIRSRKESAAECPHRHVCGGNCGH